MHWRYLVVFLKQVITGNVFEPLFALVTFEDPGPFHELIGAEQEIDHHYREFKHKCGDEAQWNGVAPHINCIADHTETAVTARAEDTGDQGRVDSSSHNIIGIDQQHIFQIVHGRVCQ